MPDDELCAVVRRGAETKDFDYKGPTTWDEGDKKACCEIVKDILAMANTLGGYIVVGVSEVDGRWRLDGLTKEQLKTWDTTRVNQFLQSYADPPINVTLHKPQCDGKEYVVLTIPRFTDTPHLCQKEFPGVLSVRDIYVRSDNNASVPLRASVDLRAIVEQAIRNRQNQMLEAMRAIMTGATVTATLSDRERFREQAEAILAEERERDLFKEKGYEGYWISIMHPSTFDPQRFTLAELRAAAADAEVSYRGWPYLLFRSPEFTRTVDDGIRTIYAGQPWGMTDAYTFWALKQSGLLVHKMLLFEDAKGIVDDEGRKVIDPNAIIFYVTEAIDTLIRLYDSLGVSDEDITWTVSLIGVRGRRLKSMIGIDDWYFQNCVAESTSIAWEQSHPIEEWRAGRTELGMTACRELFARFQWDNPRDAMMRGWMTKLLERRV